MDDSPKNRNGEQAGNGSTLLQDESNDSVTFHYIKGPDFRTIHIDGAIGGITPSGFLHIAMYCERSAIPTEMTHQVMPDGSLGPIVSREGKVGVARQMEIDIIVNESTAKSLKVWLDQKLEEFERRRSTMSEENGK